MNGLPEMVLIELDLHHTQPNAILSSTNLLPSSSNIEGARKPWSGQAAVALLSQLPMKVVQNEKSLALGATGKLASMVADYHHRNATITLNAAKRHFRQIDSTQKRGF